MPRSGHRVLPVFQWDCLRWPTRTAIVITTTKVVGRWRRIGSAMPGGQRPAPVNSPVFSPIDDGTLPRANMTGPRTIGESGHPALADGAFADAVDCLNAVVADMYEQTRRYLREASANGHCQVSHAGVRYISEDRADAFGHCYMGCRGSQRCGAAATQILGEGREVYREELALVGFEEHNSFHEDFFNQMFGRELARQNPGGNAYRLSYLAVTNGALRLHGHNTSEDPRRIRVYNCADITLDGHEYRAGWRLMPVPYISRLLP